MFVLSLADPVGLVCNNSSKAEKQVRPVKTAASAAHAHARGARLSQHARVCVSVSIFIFTGVGVPCSTRESAALPGLF